MSEQDLDVTGKLRGRTSHRKLDNAGGSGKERSLAWKCLFNPVPLSHNLAFLFDET